MRVLIAVLLFALPALAAAQTGRDGRESGRPSSLPPIGLPLPTPIGLPLAPIGLAPLEPTPTAAVPPPERARQPYHRGGQRSSRSGPSVIYVVPAYAGHGAPSSATPGAVVPAPPPAASAPATGTLRLDLQPQPTGQLFVDGAYVGTLDDLGTDLVLLAGTRQIEIREPGYHAFTLTARIGEGRGLEYRGVLEPAPAPAAAPIAHKPLYFIPGCYLGDVPPHAAGLPPTCDPGKAVTFRP